MQFFGQMLAECSVRMRMSTLSCIISVKYRIVIKRSGMHQLVYLQCEASGFVLGYPVEDIPEVEDYQFGKP